MGASFTGREKGGGVFSITQWRRIHPRGGRLIRKIPTLRRTWDMTWRPRHFPPLFPHVSLSFFITNAKVDACRHFYFEYLNEKEEKRGKIIMDERKIGGNVSWRAHLFYFTLAYYLRALLPVPLTQPLMKFDDLLPAINPIMKRARSEVKSNVVVDFTFTFQGRKW